MKLSTRSRYGTRMMLEIAKHYDRGPIQLGEIARRQGVSVKYLEQILIPLKKAGYVITKRGPAGGQMLGKAPEAITIGEIVTLLEGRSRFLACLDDPGVCPRSADCVMQGVWQEATMAMEEKLNAVTFADLVKRSADFRANKERQQGDLGDGTQAAVDRNKLREDI